MSRYKITVDEFNLLNEARDVLNVALQSGSLTGTVRRLSNLALEAGDHMAACSIVNASVTRTSVNEEESVSSDTLAEEEDTESSGFNLGGGNNDTNTDIGFNIGGTAS